MKAEETETETETEKILTAQTLEEAKALIEEHEANTATKFSIYKRDKSFLCEKYKLEDLRLLWKNTTQKVSDKSSIMPFVVIGTMLQDCQNGEDKNRIRKEKYKASRDDKEMNDPNFKKRKVPPKDTIKMGCPAKIWLKDIVLFPDYKLLKDSRKSRSDMMKKLRKDISKGKNLNSQREIKIYLPSINDHKEHSVGKESALSQTIDGRLISKIYTLVADGETNSKEMKRHLRNFVRDELFEGENPPSAKNSRFFPKRKLIVNHMFLATVKNRYDKMDQDHVAKIIERWKDEKPNDKFFFRPYASVKSDRVLLKKAEAMNAEAETSRDDGEVTVPFQSSEQRLLFVHQTPHQARLMRIYGNEMTLLDATYKTIGYPLPLYFVVVKTNIDYQIVASFVTQEETIAGLTEPLSLLKKWNPHWYPEIFMVGNCAEEINAIEHTFQNCKVKFSDFHREQAWERWLSVAAHGCTSIKDQVLSVFRRIAAASNPKDYEVAIAALEKCAWWKTTKFIHTWFSKRWLDEKQRWAAAFRKDGFSSALPTSDAIERQNREFRRRYLIHHRDKSLSEMLTVLRLTIDLDSVLRESAEEAQHEVSEMEHESDDQQEIVDHEQESNDKEELAAEQVTQEPSNNAASSHKGSKNKISACRETLKEIASLTNLMQETDDFDTLLKALRVIQGDLKLKVPTETTPSTSPKTPLGKSRKRVFTDHDQAEVDKIIKAKVQNCDNTVNVKTSPTKVLTQHDQAEIDRVIKSTVQNYRNIVNERPGPTTVLSHHDQAEIDKVIKSPMQNYHNTINEKPGPTTVPTRHDQAEIDEVIKSTVQNYRNSVNEKPGPTTVLTHHDQAEIDKVIKSTMQNYRNTINEKPGPTTVLTHHDQAEIDKVTKSTVQNYHNSVNEKPGPTTVLPHHEVEKVIKSTVQNWGNTVNEKPGPTPVLAGHDQVKVEKVMKSTVQNCGNPVNEKVVLTTVLAHHDQAKVDKVIKTTVQNCSNTMNEKPSSPAAVYNNNDHV